MKYIVLPMAGAGSRFKDAGFSEPKHRIKVHERTLFEWSLMSFQGALNSEWRVILIGRDRADLADCIEMANRLYPNRSEGVFLDHMTNGQATTVFEGIVSLSDQDEILIFNIDTHVRDAWSACSLYDEDICVPVFNVDGNQWSFVERDAVGGVRRVVEKQRVSNEATVGLYGFKKVKIFREAYQKCCDMQFTTKGEYYVANVITVALENGFKASAPVIPTENVVCLGTPKELAENQFKLI